MKIKDLAAKFSTDLYELYSEEEANAIFLIAIDHYLKLNRSAYLLKKEEAVLPEDLVKMTQLLRELLSGKPIQYILGECYFYGLKFKVNPSVLIPRPETEELVEWILEQVSNSQFSVNNLQGSTPNAQCLSVLDIGTGSGCIAISLKKNLPASKVYALDISPESIKTAKENAHLNNVDVSFIQQDILATSDTTFSANNEFSTPAISVIVSNPPYIKADEKLAMHRNVLDYEPHQALFVADDHPLIFYTAIADFALKNLADEGFLFFEINEHLGKETIELLLAKGFNNISLKKDMQGKDRMICCRKYDA